jgi:2-polyprenyl-6-hydroxyphenyl methylase / 3-demethylubiquinone-9 3-methyltransferase
MPRRSGASTIVEENPSRGILADDVARFDRLSDEWWQKDGPMKPLHKMNPVRISYLRDALTARFGSGSSRTKPLQGLKLLDIGCGGGLLSEPLARLGAHVTGIDLGAENIAAARRHAEAGRLMIDYRAETVESMAESGAAFDAVIASEVIEHVADPPGFIAAAARCIAPGGLFFGSTINRTRRSFAFAIIGAEYILRLLPRGTHQWDRFVTPQEFARYLEAAGLAVTGQAGMIYNPLTDHWRIGADLSVNYWIAAEKPA